MISSQKGVVIQTAAIKKEGGRLASLPPEVSKKNRTFSGRVLPAHWRAGLTEPEVKPDYDLHHKHAGVREDIVHTR